MTCPHCHKVIPNKLVASAAAAAAGRAGRGKVKARTSDQARAAVRVRWDRWKKAQAAGAKQP